MEEIGSTQSVEVGVPNETLGTRVKGFKPITTRIAFLIPSPKVEHQTGLL
jgi:hypothetical protein